MIQMNLQNRRRLTDLEKELLVTSREVWRGEILWEFPMDMYSLLYLKWVANNDVLYSTGNPAPCYVKARTGGGFGGEGYMYMYIYS